MDNFTFQYGSKAVRVYSRSGGVTTSGYPARPVNARSNAFPDGFARRLTNARLGLDRGEPVNALAILKHLRADWRDYWND